MSCPRASEIMFLVLDQEATPDQASELDDHLADCETCAAEWRALQSVERLFAAPETVEAPVTLLPLVMQGVARQRHRQARWQIVRTGLYAMLGILALAATPALAVSTFLRDNPSVAAALVDLWSHLAALLRGAAGGIQTFLPVVLGGQTGLIALGWVLLTVLMILGWLRVLAGARSQGVGA
jgi:anti-sigma factor RsiW